MSAGTRSWGAVVLVAVLTAAWSALGTGMRATYGSQTSADEPQYLLTAHSLGHDGDLDIADDRAAGTYREWHEQALPLQDRLLDDDRRLSPHNPLLPALLAAPMVLGGWVAAKLTLAVLAGVLAGLLMWLAVHRFAVPVGVAAACALAYGMGAPLAVYGTQVYPELPAALAVTIAVAAVTGRVSGRGAVVVGAAVVALPWLSVKYTPVAAALAAVAVLRLLRGGERRLAAGLVAGLAVGGATYVAAHLAIYGGLTPYAVGTHFGDGELTVMGSDPQYVARARRIVGLFVDREFGLAAWHPGWLLAVPALAALARRRPAGAAVLALPLLAGWLNATFVALTMHGWWWPGRQVVVVLPCAVLAVAWWAARGRTWRIGAVVAGGVVGASNVIVVVVEGLAGRLTWIVDFASTVSPAYRAARAVLPDGRAPDGTDLALFATWTTLLVALAVLGWRTASADGAAVARVDGDQDAAAGERADADVALVDAHRDGAVG